MNTQTEQVTIELTTDQIPDEQIPTNEARVQQLMREIKAMGQVVPIVIWLVGNRVADGFHRLEALRRLGIQTVMCIVREFTPEEFLDYRINSAIEHKSVEFARIVQWAREAFAATPWAERMGAAQAFSLGNSKAKGAGWSAIARIHESGSSVTYDEAENIAKWVREKSETWGLLPEQIARMLDLADILSPAIVPIVRDSPRPEERAISRSTVYQLVKRIPDTEAQEAVTGKILEEKLREPDARELIGKYAQAKTITERERILEMPWQETKKPTEVDEEQRERDRQLRQLEVEREFNKQWIEACERLAAGVEYLALEKHPDMSPDVADAITTLAAKLAHLEGKRVSVIDRLETKIRFLEGEMDKLADENEKLRHEVVSLQSRLEQANRALGVRSKVVSEQARLQEGVR